MYILIRNEGDGERLWSTLLATYQTHDEAHRAMASLISSHKADALEDDPSSEYTTQISEDEGALMCGDPMDWEWYEKYIIFDTDNPRTVGY